MLRKPKASEIRWLTYLLILLGVAAWRYLPRPWHPTQILQTAHYQIFSTATPQQTADMARALELLYNAYSNRLGNVSGFHNPPSKLQVKLFKDRAEMRRINPGMGWAEAFYLAPYCRAYYSDAEINPYHWMLHEATHQLNHEVAHLGLAKWLEEGLATYFSTSHMQSDLLAVGRIDLNTYPVWWMDTLATSTNLSANLTNHSVIPLRALITGQGGPDLDQEFNLYYLHWWTLTHFLFESEKYHDRALLLAQRGGDLEAFEQLIGPVDQVQSEWHEYVLHLKAALSGKEREFWKRKNLKKGAFQDTSASRGHE